MSSLSQPLHGVLRYQWADYPESLNVFPVNVANLRTTCNNAVIELQRVPGTNEVLKRQQQLLQTMGLRVDIHQQQPSDCASTIISMFNGSTPNPINLVVGETLIPVHGDQLVFAISNLLQVDIFYFSTRAQPRLIIPRDPLDPSKERPCIAILHHVDSYSGTSQWFNVSLDDTSKTRVPQTSHTSTQSGSPPYTTPPAFLRSAAGSSKSRKGPIDTKISRDALTAAMSKHLESHIASLYETFDALSSQQPSHSPLKHSSLPSSLMSRQASRLLLPW